MNFAPGWHAQDSRWVFGWLGIGMATILSIVALVLDIHALIHWADLRGDGRIYAIAGIVLPGILLAFGPVLFTIAARLINFPDY
ncbi:hypothetical protein E6C70_09230 [Glaciibacter flavus]|uniref:Uncharacterized protein n=1 Tax=Orlajensenia flava TaxID=2565934 RepID=A0A4V3WU39_9MICO|nr:hypothetical protein [Glaciibacter flavus]THG34437.1 hypothetical protein E6C70_09230 [Glaciibacter flavus]